MTLQETVEALCALAEIYSKMMRADRDTKFCVPPETAADIVETLYFAIEYLTNQCVDKDTKAEVKECRADIIAMYRRRFKSMQNSAYGEEVIE